MVDTSAAFLPNDSLSFHTSILANLGRYLSEVKTGLLLYFSAIERDGRGRRVGDESRIGSRETSPSAEKRNGRMIFLRDTLPLDTRHSNLLRHPTLGTWQSETRHLKPSYHLTFHEHLQLVFDRQSADEVEKQLSWPRQSVRVTAK